MAKYVGAIDQGTTSTRFMIFDHDGHEVARHQLAHEQIAPRSSDPRSSDQRPGWLEHDPHEIWEATQDVVEAAMGRAGITAHDLAAIGIATQRGTTVVWDRRTGEPYHNAIVGQDTRAGGAGERIRWILENVDGCRADADAGHAIFGTIDSWLIWWLTGGPDGGRHVTDVTNAGRTMLMDLETLEWDDALLALLDVPRSMLPMIRSSSEVYGRTIVDGPFKGEAAVAGDLGDQQAALVGQACFEPGELTIAYGTRNVLVLNTGTEIVRSTDGLLATVAYRLGDAPAVYALESTATGLPHDAGSQAAHAELEAACRRSVDAVEQMAAAADLGLRILRVGGAPAGDELCMQMHADVLGVPVSRPVVTEATALGAAFAAGLAVGFWDGTDELVASWKESKRWEP